MNAEETIQQARRLLTSLPEALWAQRSPTHPPSKPYGPTSQAHRDEDVIGQQGVGAVLLFCHAGILSAKDHMEALDRVLEPQKLSLAPWSVTRTILEAEARAAWVIDLTATPVERVSRAVMLGLRDTEWLLRAVRGDRVEEENDLRGRLRERTRQERERLKRTARDANVRPQFGNSGLVRRVGTVGRVESPDTFVEEVFGNVNYYDLLSQIVHANADSLWLTVEEVLPAMMFDTVYWFARVFWWEYEYRGMDCDRLVPILSEAWERADFPPDTEFWR